MIPALLLQAAITSFLLQVIFVLIILGLVLYLVDHVPMHPVLANGVRALLIILVVIWIAYAILDLPGIVPFRTR